MAHERFKMSLEGMTSRKSSLHRRLYVKKGYGGVKTMEVIKRTKGRMSRSVKPFKKGQQRLVHGLLGCNVCGCLWNRDVNGAKNILHVAQALLSGEDRPAYLRRQGSRNQSVISRSDNINSPVS